MPLWILCTSAANVSLRERRLEAGLTKILAHLKRDAESNSALTRRATYFDIAHRAASVMLAGRPSRSLPCSQRAPDYPLRHFLCDFRVEACASTKPSTAAFSRA